MSDMLCFEAVIRITCEQKLSGLDSVFPAWSPMETFWLLSMVPDEFRVSCVQATAA